MTQNTNNRVWYVAYGSNMQEKRFMDYIDNCIDKTHPTKSLQVTIPGKVIFAGEKTATWGPGGTAFLDYQAAQATTLARAWQITEGQCKEVQKQEGSRYAFKLSLSEIDGIPACTFTNQNPDSLEKKNNPPGDNYKKVCDEGRSETLNLPIWDKPLTFS